MQVELVYEKTCPNIKTAREQLLRAFGEARLTPRWQEWEVSTADAPAHVHGYGSPTILVNREDVSESMQEGDDNCCRIYAHGEGVNKGVPAMADIVRAMKNAQQLPGTGKPKSRFSRFTIGGASLPAIGVALLPKLTCPACWPAYAGVLSAMGLGFINYTPYLFPLTGFFLVIVLASMAYGAERRHGYKPLLLGLIASVILLTGKFEFDSNVVMYSGLGLLMVASLWNSWPKPNSKGNNCSACDGVNSEA